MARVAGIDIIIPVYNALDDLKLCINSIKKHTDLSIDRLILIDDKSPDENISVYLKSIEGPGIVVLQNEENQGFSGTINRGLSYSDRDVLLLNTDTVVTANWIDKIITCAYSDSAIGTVTPFSNNATLCSIPNFCKENTIPYGMTIDEYAQVIEHCSMKVYPRISVAVGFCMFIKREVINVTGYFDKETFGRGYGEENDFCWRAEQLGYYHVLCDDTYIYHSGSESFPSEEKKKLIESHLQILTDRYPLQNHANNVYVRDNPHQFLRDNVDIYARINNGKKNILHVLHLDFRNDAENNIGGTQFHVKDLMQNLRHQYNIFVLARDREFLRLTIYLETERISFIFPVGKRLDYQPFYNNEIASVFSNVINAFSINAVHIHHTIGLSFDIFHLTKKLGIPLVATLHDYYYICPTVKLLEHGKTYCGGCSENCTSCLHAELGYSTQIEYIPTWRKYCGAALAECDALFTPSQAAKDIYLDVYPTLAEKLHVIPHGMDDFSFDNYTFKSEICSELNFALESTFVNGNHLKGWVIAENIVDPSSELYVLVQDTSGKEGAFPALLIDRPDVASQTTSSDCFATGFSVQLPDCYFASGKLEIQLLVVSQGKNYYGKPITITGYVKKEKTRKRVAFLGGLTVAKGSHLAYEIIRQSERQYDWYVIGGIGDQDLLSLKNITHFDWYKRENVGNLLRQNQIDLVCILPIWPETFCYTISEAEIAGIPILAADIGALGERIRQDGTGWLINSQSSAEEILATIQTIFEDKDKFEQVKANLAKFKHVSISNMSEIYANIYKNLPEPLRYTPSFDAKKVFQAFAACQPNYQVPNSVQVAGLLQRIHELEHCLVSLDQSVGYKLLKYFRRINFPMKRLIKASVRFAYRIYSKLKK